jgi:adenosine/AMP kinase
MLVKRGVDRVEPESKIAIVWMVVNGPRLIRKSPTRRKIIQQDWGNVSTIGAGKHIMEI